MKPISYKHDGRIVYQFNDVFIAVDAKWRLIQVEYKGRHFHTPLVSPNKDAKEIYGNRIESLEQ